MDYENNEARPETDICEATLDRPWLTLELVPLKNDINVSQLPTQGSRQNPLGKGACMGVLEGECELQGLNRRAAHPLREAIVTVDHVEDPNADVYAANEYVSTVCVSLPNF